MGYLTCSPKLCTGGGVQADPLPRGWGLFFSLVFFWLKSSFDPYFSAPSPPWATPPTPPWVGPDRPPPVLPGPPPASLFNRSLFFTYLRPQGVIDCWGGAQDPPLPIDLRSEGLMGWSAVFPPSPQHFSPRHRRPIPSLHGLIRNRFFPTTSTTCPPPPRRSDLSPSDKFANQPHGLPLAQTEEGLPISGMAVSQPAGSLSKVWRFPSTCEIQGTPVTKSYCFLFRGFDWLFGGGDFWKTFLFWNSFQSISLMLGIATRIFSHCYSVESE